MAETKLESWVWEQAAEMIERAERLRRQFFRPASLGRPPVSWEPPVDVFEAEGCLWLIVALPGVAPGSIEVGIREGLLVVEAERRMPAICRRAQVHRLEIPHGRFRRALRLPAGAFRIERHELDAGCLALCLIRKEETADGR